MMIDHVETVSTDPYPNWDGDRPSCFGLFTCISPRCKGCPVAFNCSKDSGSKIVHEVMVNAKLRNIERYRERDLDCSLDVDGCIIFH
ncbi:MAG: hypothetical protein LUQ09_07680 [Methanomassiliicoccales archaeon]|nr:hypothetical protein [Methanomassiliicoccales archaeon]